MTTKRASSRADKPVTGVAAGNLGTGANLDETQVLDNDELRAAAPSWLEEEVEEAPAPAAAISDAGAPVKSRSDPPFAPAGRAATRRSPLEPGTRRRAVALMGVGAFATLFVLAGAGLLSQLDLGASGAEASDPGFGVQQQAQPTATPQPKKEDQGGKGKGNCKHCGGGGNEN